MTTRQRHEIEQIRSGYHWIRSIDSAFATGKLPEDTYKEMRRDAVIAARKSVKMYVKYYTDPIAESLRTPGTMRYVYKGEDMSDGPTYFWIDPDVDMSDEDIREIREDNTYRCTSPYDCCGQQFTSAFHTARTPAGVVFINYTNFDY